MRKTAMKKAVLYTLIATMFISITGCGRKEQESTLDFKVSTKDSYPIQTDENQQLTYWVALHESVAAQQNSLNETPFAKALIEKTGIHVKFIHPPLGQIAEKFNLMIASNDLPDIVEYNWYAFPGGPNKAISDGIIQPLNEVFEKAAPNITKILNENESIKKDSMTDEGKYYGFPLIRGNEYLLTYAGLMARKDLLDKAGLQVPETIREWDTALRKFKEMGVKTPLAITLNNAQLSKSHMFLGAYGLAGDFQVDNGKVSYGPYEEKYADFVKLMTKWYADGILDQNFFDTDVKRITSVGTSGDWGAIFGSAGGHFGAWIPAIKEKNPSAEFVPAKYPVLNKGERPKFGQKSFYADRTTAAITTKCKNVELAARLLDYGYSQEGHMLYNFGIEGESYEMVEGKPTYTKAITDTTKNGGLPMSHAMAKYMRSAYVGPFVQDADYFRQYASMPIQQQAVDLWKETDTLDYILPLVTQTPDENKEYSKIMQDVDIYREEMLYKFVTGKESLDNLPVYFKTLKDIGIERAVQIQQQAYGRYQNRK